MLLAKSVLSLRVTLASTCGDHTPCVLTPLRDSDTRNPAKVAGVREEQRS